MSKIKKGMLVKSGETVGYLLPNNEKNVFVAFVSDKDIEQIKKKDTVSVKIAGYNDTKYEYMKGTVTLVGDVALKIDGIGSAYEVDIKIDDLPKDAKVGMQGSCDIIIGKRSVLDYFIEPFKDGLKESLKER